LPQQDENLRLSSVFTSSPWLRKHSRTKRETLLYEQSSHHQKTVQARSTSQLFPPAESSWDCPPLSAGPRTFGWWKLSACLSFGDAMIVRGGDHVTGPTRPGGHGRARRRPATRK